MLSKRSTRNMVRWVRNNPSSYAIAAGLGNMAARGVKRARTSYASYTSTRKRGTSGIGITTQHDRRPVYRKRRMPANRRRRWKRFVNKVNFVNEKDMGTRSVVFSTAIAQYNTTLGDHGVISLNLYGQKAPAYPYNGDLYNIAGLENSGDPTAAAGSTVSKMAHIRFQSAVLDITLRNNSTYRAEADGTFSLDGRAALEVDVYEIYCREDFSTSGTNYQTLGEAIQNETNQELKIGGAGDPIAISKRGVTPWETPTALSRLGIKILKKTKYFIPNSNTITYQLRDPKRRSCLLRELRDEESANKPRWTKWVFIVYKLVPGLTVGLGADSYQEQIAVGVSRKYTYKVEGVAENRHRYISQGVSILSPN